MPLPWTWIPTTLRCRTWLNSKKCRRARGHGSPAHVTFSLDEAGRDVECGRLSQAGKRPSAPFQYNSTLLSIRMLTGNSDRLDPDRDDIKDPILSSAAVPGR